VTSPQVWVLIFAAGLATGVAVGLGVNDNGRNTMSTVPDVRDLPQLVRGELESLGVLKVPRRSRSRWWVAVLTVTGVAVAWATWVLRRPSRRWDTT
jgi:hypothetical protein